MDTSADLGRVLGNADGRLWRMRNGYLLPHDGTLPAITQAIAQLGAAQLSGQLRVGLQADTEVTIAPSGHGVSQVYCSALPVAYTQHPAAEWEPFARLVLQAAYEASLHIAMQMANTARPRLFLTRLGGGAFGNPQDWITDSMRAALLLFRHRDIDVTIVSHARADPRNAPLLAMFT